MARYTFNCYELVESERGSWIGGGDDKQTAVAVGSAFFAARQQSSHLDTHWGVVVLDPTDMIVAQIGPKEA